MTKKEIFNRLEAKLKNRLEQATGHLETAEQMIASLQVETELWQIVQAPAEINRVEQELTEWQQCHTALQSEIADLERGLAKLGLLRLQSA